MDNRERLEQFETEYLADARRIFEMLKSKNQETRENLARINKEWDEKVAARS